MHILVTNDDGPPSYLGSPYLHSLVRALQAAGHLVSVCVPDTQRSWIGKAHLMGQSMRPTYYHPPPPDMPPAGLTPPAGLAPAGSSAESMAHHTEQQHDGEPDAAHDGTTHELPSDDPAVEEWVLIGGTPASCVQIGLFHFFQDRGPVDLVVSGPNFGRNTTAVFSLSSGTMGGALEAATCRHRAVALSFAFYAGNHTHHEPDIVGAACRHSVRIIETLAAKWPTAAAAVAAAGNKVVDVPDLYSVNVPLLPDVESRKTVVTPILQNYWQGGSCFTATDAAAAPSREEEARIRSQESGESTSARAGDENLRRASAEAKGNQHKLFKWAPKFDGVWKSVDESTSANDGKAVRDGFTSVTPLRANFWHVETRERELSLLDRVKTSNAFGSKSQSRGARKLAPVTTGWPGGDGKEEEGRQRVTPDKPFYALIAYEDPYVQPLILEAMHAALEPGTWTLLDAPSQPSQPSQPGTGSTTTSPSDGGVISLSALASEIEARRKRPQHQQDTIFQGRAGEADDASPMTATRTNIVASTVANNVTSIANANKSNTNNNNNNNIAMLARDYKILQIAPYERLDFEQPAALGAGGVLINSYVIRKALVRKHFLSATVDGWTAKRGAESVLGAHVRRTEAFELDYAEFLDDALVEAFDLRASLDRNAGRGMMMTTGLSDEGVGGQAQRHQEHDSEGGAAADQITRAGASGDGEDQDKHDNSNSSSMDGGETGGGDGSSEEEAPLAPDKREWWILKPGMSDRGQGIRLFSTMDELAAIFEEWEEDEPASDEEEGEGEGQDQEEDPEKTTAAGLATNKEHGIMTSHLRHFVAQPYIHPPLLLQPLGGRKFHIRTYVLAVGRLRVYVYRDMLALFAGMRYRPPWETLGGRTAAAGGWDRGLEGHLTNTCLQQRTSKGAVGGEEGDLATGAVHRFWDLAGFIEEQLKDSNSNSNNQTVPSPSSSASSSSASSSAAESIFAQICAVTGEVFEAAARGSAVHFQPVAHAFEVFGVDFLVDGAGKAWLLEVNAFPDFAQTGSGPARAAVAGFWRGVVRRAVVPFVGGGEGEEDEDDGMVLVREVSLGRR